MNYLIILFVLVLCIIITLFLVKESYTSQKRTKVSIVISIISIIITFLSILFSNTFLDNAYYVNDNSINFNNNNDIVATQNQFVTFDGLYCFILSKNFDDTKINNSNSEFIFYNHPDNKGNKNTLKFSFDLHQKYNFFSSCISINDNTDNTNLKSNIQIYADDFLIFSSEDLYENSLPLYIDLDLSNITILSFTISTDMINTNDELFRTIKFSDTSFE